MSVFIAAVMMWLGGVVSHNATLHLALSDHSLGSLPREVGLVTFSEHVNVGDNPVSVKCRPQVLSQMLNSPLLSFHVYGDTVAGVYDGAIKSLSEVSRCIGVGEGVVANVGSSASLHFPSWRFPEIVYHQSGVHSLIDDNARRGADNRKIGTKFGFGIDPNRLNSILSRVSVALSDGQSIVGVLRRIACNPNSATCKYEAVDQSGYAQCRKHQLDSGIFCLVARRVCVLPLGIKIAILIASWVAAWGLVYRGIDGLDGWSRTRIDGALSTTGGLSFMVVGCLFLW